MKTIYCEPCVTAGRAGMKCETCGAVVARAPAWAEEELRDGDRICEAAGVTRTEGGRLPVQKVCSRIRRMRDALDSIATSYPVTDEGETLADIAREALK